VSESYGPIKLTQEQWNQVGRPDPAAAPMGETITDVLLEVFEDHTPEYLAGVTAMILRRLSTADGRPGEQTDGD
jgi:hypothetical protein